jgi:hypothetical protein
MSGILSVRKTLVLGLGSTGLKVAEQLAEHLNWQYGSFEQAAWVRLLVLETAQPHSALGDRVLWGGMTKEEYAPYLSTPRIAGAEFGFYEWQDGPALKDINNPSDGAGNLRMLGRLCLFHPSTYSNLKRRVMEDLAYLNRLTPQLIADRLGEPGREVQIHQGGTVVYVVGTLCGGTCSGGAADLGYLLDVWSNHGVRAQAILTVPHPTYSGARRFKKNAYYALRELNHYQLGDSVWSQQLPGSETPFVNAGRPYDITRVLMPAGPSGEDIDSLNTMIAQYLAAAVGPAGFKIAASDVDAFGKMESTEVIGFMRPLFSTMGVAALEYPGEHIQRAATCRLLGTAYRRWCEHRIDPDAVKNAMRLLGSTDFEALLQRITQGADKMSTAAFQQMFRPETGGEPPTVEQVRQLLREVDGRLTALELGPGDAGQTLPTLLQVIQNNHAQFLSNIGREVDQFVSRSLFDLESGPGFVATVLRGFLQEMEAWARTAQDALPRYQQDAKTLREILDQQIEEVERSQAGFGWNKREKLRHGWEGVTDRIDSYLAAEMRAQTINHLQRRDIVREMVEQYRKVVALLLQRMDQMLAAFKQEAAVQETQAKDLAAFSPRVNGKVYFEPEPPAARGTVTEEYYKLLRQVRWPEEPVTGYDNDQKEAAAARAIIRTLEPLRSELTGDEGRSVFDAQPGGQSARDLIPPAVLQAAQDGARALFKELRSQVHIADKAGDADVDTVVQASEPKPNISATQVSDQLAGARGVSPVLAYLAFMDTESNGAASRPAVARVEQRVRNSMELREGGIINSDDPYRLLIIREKHGFTLGQMEGVVRSNRYDHSALQSAEEDSDFKFWHTRRDVDWVDPLVPPTQVETAEEAWLLALLLGRPADPGLAWLPATRGEIEAEGWYQLVAGGYFVTYVEGPDVSEPGATLPLAFNTAVAKLLISSPEYALIKRTLNLRFNAFCHNHGHANVVRTLDQAVRSMEVYGVRELDTRKADRLLRRAYRRNDGLTNAFFEYKTEGLTGTGAIAEFAHLRRLQGSPKEDGSGTYQNDGYYCPACHNYLGGDVQRLLDGQFRCPACNTEERYWP